MNCPACRRPMMAVEYQQIELDYCPHCHGVWFDQGELELALLTAGVGDVAHLLQDILHTPATGVKEQPRRCPICSKKMKKSQPGGSDGVTLDTCGQGDGLWFDGGEVDHLVKIMADKLPASNEQKHVFSFMQAVFHSPAR